MKSIQLRALEDMLLSMSENNQLRDKNIVVGPGLGAMLLECKSVIRIEEEKQLVDGTCTTIATIDNIKLWIDLDRSLEDTGLYNLNSVLIFSIKGLQIEVKKPI